MYDNSDTDAIINAVFIISGIVMAFQYRIGTAAQ
jgi:hypothetical protein